MRRRRAERLLLRADVAADAGCVEDARACLAEARDLAPGLDRCNAIEDKLGRPVAEPATPRLRWFLAAAAVIAVIVAGTWRAQTPAIAPAPDLRSLPVETLRTRPPALERDAVTSAPTPPEVGLSTEAPPPGEAVSTHEPALKPTYPKAYKVLPTDVRHESTRAAASASVPPTLTPVNAVAANSAAATARVDAPLPGSPRDAAAVRDVLERYADAYTGLDANAAADVWPRVDRAALTRTFKALAWQRLVLDACHLDVSAVAAQATCTGSTSWALTTGNTTPHTERRHWTFDFARAGSDWQIVDVRENR